MRISLVITTRGRTDSLAETLASLADQTHPADEIVIVDQNVDDRLAPILAPYQDRLPVRLATSAPGASRGRNAGAALAQGDVLGFPDDDCVYPTDVLARVGSFFEQRPEYGGLTGRTVDPEGRGSLARWDPYGGDVDRGNVWRRGVLPAMWFRRDVIGAYGGFDERIGPGAGTTLGAGEEADLLLRYLEAGVKIAYDPSLAVIHPDPLVTIDARTAERGYWYSRGMGYVLRRHRYSIGFVAGFVLRPVGGAALALCRGQGRRAKYHWAVARGRWTGWRLGERGVAERP